MWYAVFMNKFRKADPIRMTKAEERVWISENCDIINESLLASKNNFIFGFLDVEEHPLDFTYYIGNQIVVVYRGGSMEMLPIGVNGTAIKDFLGVRYGRIRYWGVMPDKYSDLNPCQFNSQKTKDALYLPYRDVYARIRRSPLPVRL